MSGAVKSIARIVAPAAIGFFAGPQIASALFGNAVLSGAITGTVFRLAGGVIGSVVSGAISSALTPKAKQQAQAQAPQEVEQIARGALVNTASQTDPITVVYGTRRKGGTRVLTEVSGATNEFLHIVIALSEGEVSAINAVYLDDTATTDARFSGLVTLEKYVGTDSQAASAALISATGGKWTANDQGKGVAYVYLKLKWSESAFPSGMPVVTADVDGKLVFDPRDGNTKFSSNPALCVRDYMTNTRYGRSIPATVLDEQSFKDAADYCEAQVATPTGTQSRYTCDGIADPDSGWLDNLRLLLSSCRGSVVFVAGKYKLKIDRDEVAQTTGFTEDNIVGSWEITNAGKRDKHNRVRARFFNPDRRWEPDITVWDDTVHRTEDNGLVLEREIDLPFTADLFRAQRIAQLEERVSRFGIAAAFNANGDAMSFEVGDVVPITHTTPDWAAKPFRIIAMEPLFSGDWRITVVEYQNIAYSLSELTSAGAVPATNLPSIFSFAAPSNIALASGTAELFIAGDGTVHSRIRATWDQPSNIFVLNGGRVEVQFKEFAGSPSEFEPSVFFDGATTQTHLSPVNDGSQYTVRIRFENSAGVRSAWTESSPHTVIGKTALPANVTGFSAVQQGAVVIFDSDRVTDADLDSVEIRYIEAGGIWENANPLTNILRGETATSAAMPPGTWDALSKAKDTSGNYSATAARFSITVTASEFTSIKEQQELPKMLGTPTNMVRHWDGVLTPDSMSLASALGWEVFDQFVPNAFVDCFYEAVEIDKTINASARVWADIVSVLGPGETTGVANPKFQIDHRKSTTSYDGFENWTVGGANFRHLKARIHVDTTVGKPVVSGFEVNIDNQSRSEEFKSQDVAGIGTTLTFATAFHNVPSVQVTTIGTTAKIPGHETATTTSVVVRLFDTAGNGTSGVADVTATGP